MSASNSQELPTHALTTKFILLSGMGNIVGSGNTRRNMHGTCHKAFTLVEERLVTHCFLERFKAYQTSPGKARERLSLPGREYVNLFVYF